MLLTLTNQGQDFGQDGNVNEMAEVVNSMVEGSKINGSKVFCRYGSSATTCQNGTLAVYVHAKRGNGFNVVYVKVGQKFTIEPAA